MASVKETRLLEMIKAPFGYPVLKTFEVTDTDILSTYVKQALLEYFMRTPFCYGVEVDATDGVTLTIPQLHNDPKYSSKIKSADEYYFVGVVNVDKLGQMLVGSSQSQITPWLMQNISSVSADSIDAMLMTQTSASIQELVEAEVIVNYDSVLDKVHVSPTGGKVGVMFGFGFNKIDFVPTHHFKVLSMITSLNMAKSLKVFRGTLQLQGDIDLNEDILMDVIQDLTDKLPAELESITMPMLVYA